MVFAPFIRDALHASRGPWRVSPRRLLDYLLVAVREGDCRFVVDDCVYELGPGDFFLAQPGQVVDLVGRTATLTPYLHFDLFYNARRDEGFATRPGQLDLTPYLHLLQPNLESCGLTIPTSFKVPALSFWHQQLDQIINLAAEEGMQNQLESQARLGALMLDMARHFTPRLSAVNGSARGQLLGWIPSYLSTHLADDLSVGDMARRARLSPSRFQFLFRQVYGTSPGRYLLNLRIGHASELLEGTDWTLSHIASLCGFANVQHFAKSYKLRTGVTPGSRRKTARPIRPHGE